MTPDEFFGDNSVSKQLFDVVLQQVQALGDAGIRISKSQIAFRRRRNFAYVWMPGRYLKGKVAPLVLTVSLPSRDDSPRWKEIVEPAPQKFTHHLELYDPADVDDQVRAWLREAWETAS